MMDWRLAPAIVRGTTMTAFPTPVDLVHVRQTWDGETIKIPQQPGEQRWGLSPNGVVLEFRGAIERQTRATVRDAQAMFTLLEAWQAALDVSAAQPKFTLRVFVDDATGHRRCFRECSTVDCELSLADPQRWTYAVRIHADDPQFHLELSSP